MPNNPIPEQIPFQNIPPGTSTTEYVVKLISFLEHNLPLFPKEKTLHKTQNENDLTEELYNFLTRKAWLTNSPFVFQPEKSQKRPNQKGHAKRMDIATKINTLDIDMELIYCLEAKKLPTDKIGGKREKEYVEGKGGAIERFRNEVHGLDDQGNLLSPNGIIAYVTENSFQHWHEQINLWITDVPWPSNECLNCEYFSSIGKLTSNHLRVSGSNLDLIHFWVNI
ncbi:hypothetical protein [Haliscomenobacter hydrossis]|uniref:Uncharacterized protein n=1 Tax=Haliscomenobacter hydrossis (strain ATCC 27775 / DSM 1100 / LMG 10767 / O) TaxID=760192 RepID=F4KT02_HALH1|nr:hypothetical protein [Haliscomenobacter hydrossis]AEE50072.1 hypothetical protein Halhy_2189 [Haliscomenobacter hydrossis DSM 1100]